MTEVLRGMWRFIRQASGDDAYERYLAHQRAHHPEKKPLSRRAFFRLQQERKWSKVSRCC